MKKQLVEMPFLRQARMISRFIFNLLRIVVLIPPERIFINTNGR